jgi:hypothetical protein
MLFACNIGVDHPAFNAICTSPDENFRSARRSSTSEYHCTRAFEVAVVSSKNSKKKKKKRVVSVEPDYLLELADIALRDHFPPADTRATARELREQSKALRKSNKELLHDAHNQIKKFRAE